MEGILIKQKIYRPTNSATSISLMNFDQVPHALFIGSDVSTNYFTGFIREILIAQGTYDNLLPMVTKNK